jgi:TonB family protein
MGTFYLRQDANCQVSVPRHQFKPGSVDVVCNKRQIEQGQTVDLDNLTFRAVSAATCPTSPVKSIAVIESRKAQKTFLPGHIFTNSDFGLPERTWPAGPSLVVCAVQDIPISTVVKHSDVVQQRWNGRSFPQGAVSDPNIVIGRATKFGIQKGQVILLYEVGLGVIDAAPGTSMIGTSKFDSAAKAAYLAVLQKSLRHYWFPPMGSELKRIVVSFKVHRDGRMTNLKLVSSSGLPIADQAAIRAVQFAAPFQPLPAGAQNVADIEFNFDSSLFSGVNRAFFR